jgi:hypothetical protein
MKRRILIVGLVLLGIYVGAVSAGIPEPDAIIYGAVTIDGFTKTADDNISISARILNPPQDLAIYQMGDIATAENNYVLNIPLEFLTESSKTVFSGAGVDISEPVYIYITTADSTEYLADVVAITGRGHIQNKNIGATTADDSDGDGLLDVDENTHGSDPHNPDTDGDGLLDGVEVDTHRTDPTLADSDGDGLSDGDELNIHGTSPTLSDTDGDGLSDGLEIANSLDPLTKDLGSDIDGDGYTKIQEVYHDSDPNDFDSQPAITTLLMPTDIDSIQFAIDNIVIHGDTIEVLPGHYYETINFSGMALTLTGQNPNDPNTIEATIIDANLAASAVTFDSFEDSNSILTGLTITGGRAEYGAGIHIDSASPIIDKNIITDNVAEYSGSGIYAADDSSLISLNRIIGNSGGGAAVFLDISSGIFTNNIVASNYSESDAGIYLAGGEPNVINNTIADNFSDVPAESSTGIAIDGSSAMITNNIIGGNFNGIGIYDQGSAGGSPMDPNLFKYNNVYGNPDGNYYGIADQNEINGNISVDPLFADPASDDYHLQSQGGRWDPNSEQWVLDAETSLCIDSGDPNSEWAEEMWPHGERINMGAYGNTVQASMLFSDGYLRLDSDFILPLYGVDFLDFSYFLEHWAEEDCPLTLGCHGTDLDRSGTVDFKDYAIFADEFLEGSGR